MGLSAALATAGHSLEVFTTGLEVAGQNISNASTPGYIREELKLETAPPYRRGNLILGTGVNAPGIVQAIDKYLETRIHAAGSDASAAAARETAYQRLEAEIRELGETDLSTSLSGFLAAINEVVNQPELAPFRQLAIQQGERFAGDVASLRRRIDDLRQREAARVESLVVEANKLIDQVKDLNIKIVRLERGGLTGSEAGALRTQRYEALNRLAEIVPIQSQEHKDGRVDVFSGSDYLVLGGTVQHLETVPEVDRGVLVHHVRLSKTQAPIAEAGAGELAGVIQGRDQILGQFVDDLDAFAANVIFEFNKIHASGEGLTGFSSALADNRVTDTTAALNDPAAGLAFTPSHGSFQLKVKNVLSELVETTTINIDLDAIDPANDTSLDDLRAAIDAVANVSAAITADGRLRIDADSNYEVRFAEDTSGVLAALGINSFFKGSDSRNIGIDATLKGDHHLLATSQGGGPSDNRNAVALAGFAEAPVAALGGVSLEEYYDSVITGLAQSSASESALASGFRDFRESLWNQRTQFSGVSLDEEAIRIIEFQRAFQAAARIISTVDELFTTLLNM